MLQAIIKEIRVKQYTKNLLVFAGALFAGDLTQPAIFLHVLLAFFAFCAIASTVYVLNDIMDVEKDRQHPTKRFRPIASGAIPMPMAHMMLVILLVLAFALAYAVNWALMAILALYFVMNIAYSMRLKHIVILDVMIIAIGFVLRAIAGVAAIGTPATTWFIVCIFMLSLFLALAKRRAELNLLQGTEKKRKVLEEYSLPMLDALIVAVLAISITSYALFSMQTAEGQMFLPGLPDMMLTIPLVVYGMFRYIYLISKGQGEKPEDILLHDTPILLTCVLYTAFVFLIRNLG